LPGLGCSWLNLTNRTFDVLRKADMLICYE
jgi:hypothetical protein